MAILSISAICHQTNWQSCLVIILTIGYGASSVLPAREGGVLLPGASHTHSRETAGLQGSGSNDRTQSPTGRGVPSPALQTCLQVHHDERGFECQFSLSPATHTYTLCYLSDCVQVAWHDLAFFDPDMYESLRKLMVESEGEGGAERLVAMGLTYQVSPISGQRERCQEWLTNRCL